MIAGATGSTSNSPSGGCINNLPSFQAAAAFEGARPGTVFKLGHLGLGYYIDFHETSLPDIRPQLPEKWRDAAIREERLRVDPSVGAGVSLDHSEFGFAVASIDALPGQPLHPGEVIVAIEGRLLAGLSAPQMQASFLKRRQDGARLQVASLQEIRDLMTRDPNIIELWDPVNQHAYYFNKKTGQSSWTREQVQPPETEVAETISEASKPPVDLTHFLSHGFTNAKHPPQPNKRKLAATKANATTVAGKDESDLARDERQRWKDWNDGGKGGYTEQFFLKYKNCQSNPAKPKKDKRMEGSVGPGQGMEYMAKWTGSKNSFN